MMSAFDHWVTKEGPDWVPVEIDLQTYERDEDLQNLAPFDETRCNGPFCKDGDAVMIGAHLIEGWHGGDVPVFHAFWMMDEDGEHLFCEDCWILATEEVE